MRDRRPGSARACESVNGQPAGPRPPACPSLAAPFLLGSSPAAGFACLRQGAIVFLHSRPCTFLPPIALLSKRRSACAATIELFLSRLSAGLSLLLQSLLSVSSPSLAQDLALREKKVSTAAAGRDKPMLDDDPCRVGPGSLLHPPSRFPDRQRSRPLREPRPGFGKKKEPTADKRFAFRVVDFPLAALLTPQPPKWSWAEGGGGRPKAARSFTRSRAPFPLPRRARTRASCQQTPSGLTSAPSRGSYPCLSNSLRQRVKRENCSAGRPLKVRAGCRAQSYPRQASSASSSRSTLDPP